MSLQGLLLAQAALLMFSGSAAAQVEVAGSGADGEGRIRRR